MKVTLYEVAARAGVSIATVSRALNGLPVSAVNGARVREAVEALGYVANEAARALRSDRTQTMGLIFFDLRNTLGIELVDAIGESIVPGTTTFTRMPLGPSSAAAVLVSPRMAHFEAP